MDVKYNPLGFNMKTDALLRGIGAEDIIKEFRKRDISTDVLHKLTKEDFMQLGADENRAEDMFNVLYISKDKKSSTKLKPYQRVSNKIEILKRGEKHFDVIKSFIEYCRIKLTKKGINSFIEPDEALSASKVLCLATDSILKDVNEAELKLKELAAMTIPKKRKYSYALYCIPIGGLCIGTYIVYRLWR